MFIDILTLVYFFTGALVCVNLSLDDVVHVGNVQRVLGVVRRHRLSLGGVRGVSFRVDDLVSWTEHILCLGYPSPTSLISSFLSLLPYPP